MTYHIDSAPEKRRLEDIRDMLSKVFWCPGITGAEIEKGITHSALVVGAYLDDGRQVGFLRVISDTVRFAYILDVVVHEEYRRRGIGGGMVKYALAHPGLRDVYQWLLVTMDAHGVYRECGFESLKYPDKWMSIMKPRPDRTDFRE